MEVEEVKRGVEEEEFISSSVMIQKEDRYVRLTLKFLEFLNSKIRPKLVLKEGERKEYFPNIEGEI